MTRGVTSGNQLIATGIILKQVSGGYNRGVGMYIKAFIFLGVGTEKLPCTLRCLFFGQLE